MTLQEEAQFVAFRLDDQEYALPIQNVVQVVRMVAITPLPEAPPAIRGMINVRGRIVPVVDLRRRFGLRSRPYDLNSRLVIACHNGSMMALLVDQVSEVVGIPPDCIESQASLGRRVEGVAAVGKLGDRLLLILDPGKVLSVQSQELR